jgi:hypothetical protein
VLNAFVSLNLFDADNSVGGRGKVNPFSSAAREARQTQACAKLFGVRFLCNCLDNARSNGTAYSYVKLVG